MKLTNILRVLQQVLHFEKKLKNVAESLSIVTSVCAGIIIGPRREKTCLQGFPKKRDSNQSPLLQIPARILKFRLL